MPPIPPPPSPPPPTTGQTARRARVDGRQLIRLGVLLGALAGAIGLLVVHGTAWVHLNKGQAALEQDDPQQARQHLLRCLETWPRSGHAHFLAGEAARRCGDLDAASHHLKHAAERGWAADAVALERALIQAQQGNLSAVESGLRRDLAEGHPKSSQILAILVPALLAQYRLIEAADLSTQWIELQPNSVAAWSLRADICERLRKFEEAVEALRNVVRLAPEDPNPKLKLARALLATHQSVEEAAALLDWVQTRIPDDPEFLTQLALCREEQGQLDEAAAIMDRLIASGTASAVIYHHRGRIDLNRGHPDRALPLLQRSVELDRSEPAALYSLLLCLQRVGTPEQIQQAEARWKQCEADLKRVATLSRIVAANPHDPEPRREMGELFLRNGRDEDGIRWLHSALREQPNHVPSHELLLQYYERHNRPVEAAHHRQILEQINRGSVKHQ